MENREYTREKRTIDLAKANGIGCLMCLPVFLIYALPFYLIWGDKLTVRILVDLFKESMHFWTFMLLLGVMVAGIVLHELIHGVSWAFFAKSGWKSIKFGVLWKYMTPYCHCKDPLTVPQYTFGALMPFVLLGFLPALASCYTGSIALLVFGMFFTVAAIGDFMIVLLIRKEAKGALILDHPTEAGYYVYTDVKIEEERERD